MGSVSVTNPDQGIAWSFFLYPGYRGLSNAPLQGLFWFPTRKTDGVVILHNTSETGMTVHPRIQMDGANHLLPAITLRGDEVAKLDLRRALRDLRLDLPAAGGIELTYEGQPDALRAHGLLFDGAGFSAQVDFNRTFSLTEPQQLTYHTPRFAIGGADPLLGLSRRTKFEPYLVLHNFGGEQLDGEISVSYRHEGGPQELKIPLVMRSGETRVLELESYLAGRVPRDAHWAGMEIRYTTNRSSLAMTMVSISEDKRRSIRSVLNWVFSTTREGWYWRADADTNTLVGIQNSGAEEGKVVFSLDYYVGQNRHSYELPLTIPARASHLVDIGEIKRRGQPDADGDVLPQDVTFGGYRAEKLRPRGAGPLTTEALILDRQGRNFLTVYNTGCCETANFYPGSMEGSVGSFDLLFIEIQDQCSGVWRDETAWGSYWSDNGNVATTSGSLVSLVGAGSTTVRSSISYLKHFGFGFPPGGEFDPQQCNNFTGLGACSVTVNPVIQSITPARGLIGATTSVTIQGNGFASGATINAGTGITATVNSVSATQIQASFNVSTSAPAGNHSVAVTVNGKHSNTVNFFVQVPTAVNFVSNTSQGQAVCPAGTAGWSRTVTLQLIDQAQPAPSAIQSAGIVMADQLTIGTPNNLGISSTATGQFPTNSQGQWPDTYFVCSSACPASGGQTNATQAWTASRVNLPNSVSVVYRCTSITINGN